MAAVFGLIWLLYALKRAIATTGCGFYRALYVYRCFSPAAGLKGSRFDQTIDDSASAENSKSQIPNHKQIPMINPPAADQTCLGHWILEFGA
jgi:hypothetical protein